MMQQQFRIAEIEVAKSPIDEKIVGLFRLDGNGQQRKGTVLVIIAEITSTLYVYERLLDVINATAEQAKYLLGGVEQDPLARFEKLIQRINESIAAFQAGEPTTLSWNRINMFILELSTNHVCLTGRGHLMNMFLQKQDDGSYRSFDLFGSLDQPIEIDPAKPFPSLICGDMRPGDILVAGTNNFERLRSELGIRERVIALPPVSAALEIRQELERRGTPDDFVAAIISCCELEMPEALPPKPRDSDIPKSTQSIDALRTVEQEATQHLSPTSIMPNQARVNSEAIKERVYGWAAAAGRGLRTIIKTDRLKDVAALANLRGMNAGHGSMFTKKRKRTMMAALAGVIVIVGGIVFWKHSQRVEAEAAIWQQAYTQAEDNRNRAESDLVYGNDERAQQELESADRLIASLKTDDRAQEEKRIALEKGVAQLHERLRKVVVANPVTELLALTDAPDGSLTSPVLTKDTAYAIDNAAHEIVKINLSTKAVQRIKLPANSDPVIVASLVKQSVVFMTGTGGIINLDTSSGAVTTLSNAITTSSTTDLVLYGGRAYVLDGPAGKIWRAQQQTNGFSAPAAYIKASNVDLANAVGIAIDSNVYVLMPDGSVSRFLSGGQEGFSFKTIDPPLHAASAIWTSAEATRIAVSDPTDKRIIIFNKDGSLKSQLTSPDFKGPRDIDADESNQRMIVVDGNRLLLVPLP